MSLSTKFWDQYVKEWPEVNRSLGGQLGWPGDEWGSPEGWERTYQRLFVPAGVKNWERAVEIGPGSGKYTLRVLANPKTAVRAYDVSPQFLEVCQARCQEPVNQGRLSLHLLDLTSADRMASDLNNCGWQRSVDAFYSIDAMVHVDLQYLIVYLITAGLTLKPGGKLILTLADATTDLGFQQMLEEIWFTYPGQTSPTGTSKFEWISPDIVRSILPRLGFELEWLNNAEKDIELIASLADVKVANRFHPYLLPRGPQE